MRDKEEEKRRRGEEETQSAIGNRQSAISSSLIPHPSSLLAIDPGTAKCGVAVVGSDGQILHRAIVPTGAIVEQALRLIAVYQPFLVICGNGTGAKPILLALQAAQLPIPIQPVDESHTSEAARVRFVRENRPPLLQRLLPRSLRTPWLPYDDYVAVILAERYWQAASERNNSPFDIVK